ncbi:MAG: D-glycerate dehydrogenase [Candidatus Zambryskibacteria bacterium]|nr:D-glycerate dehydrogenase [Candidatus Zambryskibacteria bacterium]
MKKVYITRRIPEIGISMLKEKGYEVDINLENRILTKEELIHVVSLKPYDAVLSLLTDQIDKEVFDAVPTAKIFANYAVGFNNINLPGAKERGITITNTPGALADTVGEHTVALLLALTGRIVEGDTYVRAGKYKGWDPMLLMGTDLENKTVAIIGGGRIGYRAGHILGKGFGMNIAYYDVVRNEMFEKDLNATFYDSIDSILPIADIVSLHVPLMDTTHHLINKERLSLMKKTAFLINTARGPVVDEEALVDALKNKVIAGAGLDVFEHEPSLALGLSELSNVVLTPHIASATVKARDEMAVLAVTNIIDFFEGREPKNAVKV